MIDKLLKRALMIVALIVLLVSGWKFSSVSDEDIVRLHEFNQPGYGAFVRAGDLVGVPPRGRFEKICNTSGFLEATDVESSPRQYYNLIAHAVSALGEMETFGLADSFRTFGHREANFITIKPQGQSRVYASIPQGDCECRILEQMLAGGRICVVSESVSALASTSAGLVFSYAVKFKPHALELPQERVDDLVEQCSYLSRSAVEDAAASPALCDARAVRPFDSRLRTAMGLVAWRDTNGVITPVPREAPRSVAATASARGD